MINTINYLLEANICLLIFGLFYYLVLRNDTNFRFSRYYLVGAGVLTLVIPLLHFDNPFSDSNPIPFVNQLQTMMLPELIISDGISQADQAATGTFSWSWPLIIAVIYSAVVIIMLTVFLYQLFQLFQFRNIKKDVLSKCGDYVLIPTDGQLPTFSFFNMLFFDNRAFLSEQEKKKVIDHEVAHIRQRHSVDVLALEIVKILLWVNPVAWWMRKSIQDVHEYLADQVILKDTDEEQYSSLLAKMALKQMSLPVGHHFNKSMTLKRIKMMNTPKNKLKIWKWASMIPMVAMVIVVLSCNDEVMNDVNEVMETATQTTLPPSLQAELDRLQNKYPKANFVYMETDGTNAEKLAKLAGLDPKSIAYTKIWKERERIGVIVNKAGPLEIMAKADDDEVFMIVEEPASPKGGYGAFYEHLAQVLKYPLQARKAGVEGKVYVQFIVDTDGALTDIKVVKGIGAGCDQAAIDALKTVEPFNPPYQRGKAVKQRIILPITFHLGDDSSEETKNSAELEIQEVEKENMKITTESDGLWVSGRITNEDGEPIAGVNIIIGKTPRGTVSDIDGKFRIERFNKKDQLFFSHVAYATKMIGVN